MIKVKPTLQIADAAFPNIFAFGDVADTGAPKMARATMIQSWVVADNIMSLIQGKAPAATYKSQRAIDGAIKLTLGKVSVTVCGLTTRDD